MAWSWNSEDPSPGTSPWPPRRTSNPWQPFCLTPSTWTEDFWTMEPYAGKALILVHVILFPFCPNSFFPLHDKYIHVASLLGFLGFFFRFVKELKLTVIFFSYYTSFKTEEIIHVNPPSMMYWFQCNLSIFLLFCMIGEVKFFKK